MRERKNKWWYKMVDSLVGELNRWKVAVAVFSFILAAVLLNRRYSTDILGTVETWISLGTFVLAIIYGVRSMILDRVQSLDKVITVHFKIKQPGTNEWAYLFTCHKFSLSEKGDIRALAQQIGSQMANGSRLAFTPNYDQKAPVEIKYDGKDVLHYEVTFYLTAKPRNYASYDYKQWWWDGGEKEQRQVIAQTLPTISATEQEARSMYNEKRCEFLLINLSNHKFNPDQFEAAKVLLTRKKQIMEDDGCICTGQEPTILHEPFPNINPEMDSNNLDSLVLQYYDMLMAKQPLLICINGEPTFCHRLINRLDRAGVSCYTSTTKREVMMEDDTKLSIFKHVQFRPYS